MRVDGNAQARALRFIYRGANLFGAEDGFAVRVHALENLDYVNALFDPRADELAYAREALCRIARARHVVRRERLAGDEHARPLRVAAVDAVAQGDVNASARAEVADGRDARVERVARVLLGVLERDV